MSTQASGEGSWENLQLQQSPYPNPGRAQRRDLQSGLSRTFLPSGVQHKMYEHSRPHYKSGAELELARNGARMLLGLSPAGDSSVLALGSGCFTSPPQQPGGSSRLGGKDRQAAWREHCLFGFLKRAEPWAADWGPARRAQLSGSTSLGCRGAGSNLLSQRNPCPSAACSPDLLTTKPLNPE